MDTIVNYILTSTYYRLNHSCASNAEADWNKEESAREIRAVRKIKKGEEINCHYQSLDLCEELKEII